MDLRSHRWIIYVKQRAGIGNAILRGLNLLQPGLAQEIRRSEDVERCDPMIGEDVRCDSNRCIPRGSASNVLR